MREFKKGEDVILIEEFDGRGLTLEELEEFKERGLKGIVEDLWGPYVVVRTGELKYKGVHARFENGEVVSCYNEYYRLKKV